jgi:hypothetical protein
MVVIIRKKKLLLLFLSLLVYTIIFRSGHHILSKKGSEAEKTVYNEPEYVILIQIDEKLLYLYKDGNCIRQYPIATGKKGWPSPIGKWKIVYKGDWGEGFGGRWMGLNVKWGNYGIHGTTKESSIGQSASHGCIRMFNKDIKELYDFVPVGTTVIIRNGPFGPFGTGFRELKPGDRGADVLAVQRRLKVLGYFKGNETGIYEDDLKHALYKFQEDNNLKIKYTITLPDYHAMGFKEFE